MTIYILYFFFNKSFPGNRYKRINFEYVISTFMEEGQKGLMKIEENFQSK